MKYTSQDVRGTLKSQDSWWTVYLVDPIALPLTRVVANRTPLTPTEVTVMAFVLGLASAVAFGSGNLGSGAALYYASFLLDCVDGKLARLKNQGSPFGEWLDYMLDRLRVVACASGIAYGQYEASGDWTFLALGGGIILVDVFRYLNGQQVGKTRRQMAAERPSTDKAPAGRGFFARHRLKARLAGGVEFQMAAFIVAPMTGLLIPVTLAAAAAVVVFELHLVLQFWRQARRHVAAQTAQPVAEPALAE